jgi:tape measure domain-containing protein
MAVEVGTAVVSIIPSAKGFSSKVKGELAGVPNAAGQVGDAAGASFVGGFARHLTDMVKRGAVTMGALTTAAAGYGVKIAAQNEQASISFETMLGSAEAAGSFLEDLKGFAATTPFEFPDLQKAASSLISIGVDAKRVIPIMTSLGNTTAGMGTGAEGVRRATVALQQMNAAGRITAEDLNQLRDAGIPVYDLLTAATGKSREALAEMASTGKLGRQELEQLMTALESGRGLERFAGLMDKQSASLLGMWSTLKDTFGQGLAKVLAPTVDSLKVGLGTVSTVLGQVLAEVGPQFAEMAASMVTGLGNLLPKLVPVAKVVGQLASLVRGPLFEAFQLTLPYIIDMAKQFGPLIRAAQSFVKGGLVDTFTALGPLVGKLADALSLLLTNSRVFEVLSTVFARVTIAVGRLVDGFLPLVDMMAGFADAALAELVTMLPEVATAFEQVLAAVAPLMPVLMQLATDALVGTLNGFRDMLPLLLRAAVALAPLLAAWGQLKLVMFDVKVQMLSALAPAITALITAFLPVIERVLVPMVQKFAEVVTAMSETRGGMVLLGAAVGLMGMGKLAASVASFLIPGRSALGLISLMTYAFRAHFAMIETQGLPAQKRWIQVLGKTLTGTNLVTAATWAWNTALAVLTSPLFIIPAAIAAAAAAFYLLYQNFEPYRNAVDAYVGGIKAAFEWTREFIGLLISFDFAEAGAKLSDLGGAIVNGLANVGNLIRDKAAEWSAAVWEWVTTAIPAGAAKLAELTTQVVNWLIGLPAAIGAAVAGPAAAIWGWLAEAVPNAATELTKLGARIFDFLTGELPDRIAEAVGGLAEKVSGWLAEAVPAFIDSAASFLADLPGTIASALAGAGEAIGGALTTAFEWVKNNWQTIVKGLAIAVVGLPYLVVKGLITLGPMLLDAVKAGFEWVKNNWQNILKTLAVTFGLIPLIIVATLVKLGPKLGEALGKAFTWVKDNWQTILKGLAIAALAIPGLIVLAVVKLGPMLLGFLGKAIGFVVSGFGTVLSGLVRAFLSIPSVLLKALSVGLSFLLTFAYNAVMWLVDNGPKIWDAITGFFAEMPGRIVGAIGALGTFLKEHVLDPAFGFLTDELPNIIRGFIDFYLSIPGRIAGAIGSLGTFLKEHVLDPAFGFLTDELPNIVRGVLDFFGGLPGKMKDAFVNLGGMLLDALKSAWQWVVDNGPEMVKTVIDFFTGLPSKIFNAFTAGMGAATGAVVDMAKPLWNAIADLMNDYLLRPLQKFEVTMGPHTFTPFEFVPTLRHLEKGGLMARNELAIVGEAGPELFAPRVAGRIIPNGALATVAPPAAGGLHIGQVLVTGQPEPEATAVSLARELRRTAFFGGVTYQGASA